jgi:hypothetical protein
MRLHDSITYSVDAGMTGSTDHLYMSSHIYGVTVRLPNQRIELWLEVVMGHSSSGLFTAHQGS